MTEAVNTALLVRFDEARDDIAPSDEALNLEDLRGDPDATPPLVAPAGVDGLIGRARLMAANQAYRAPEQVENATRLVRDCAIEIFCGSLNLRSSDGTRVLIARGMNDGTDAERPLWGLQLVTAGAPSAPTYTLQMFWQEKDGTPFVDAGVAFTMPDKEPLYLYAYRRWRAIDDVEIDYGVNGVVIGTTATDQGDLDDGIGGTVTFGCRGDGAHTYVDFWEDWLDECRVSHRRTAEEFRQTYLRVFVFAEQLYRALRGLLPPGQAYSQSDDSVVMRELAIEGDALALPYGYSSELEDDFLPDRATRTLGRWESVTGISPSPGDFIVRRRNRVVGFLRKIHGYSRNLIAKAVAIVLELDEADVEILEISNRFVDLFPDASIDEDIWFVPDDGGSLAEGSGMVTLSFSGAQSCLWDAAHHDAVRPRVSLAASPGCEIIAKLSALTLGSNGDAAGIYAQREGAGNVHLFGVIRDGGTDKLFQRTHVYGEPPVDTLYGAAPSLPVWLRMLQSDPEGTVDLQYSATGAEGPWTDVALAQSTVPPLVWAGLFLLSGAGPAGASSSAAFDLFRLWCPESRDVFQWYVYRDPDLDGEPDIEGAQQVVAKLQPAHTQGTVIESKAALCDDPYSLCDRDPLGG